MPQEQCEGGSCAVHALRAYQRALSHFGDHPAAKAAIERLSLTLTLTLTLTLNLTLTLTLTLTNPNPNQP